MARLSSSSMIEVEQLDSLRLRLTMHTLITSQANTCPVVEQSVDFTATVTELFTALHSTELAHHSPVLKVRKDISTLHPKPISLLIHQVILLWSFFRMLSLPAMLLWGRC